ncbi:16S rRNA (uracil(1498)-N(3))-methyltransferase [Algivirga pacifica]|uniref:Ribosomal RNA small subunit methyltransferase E n=1 Tax=Algivirga pacifica TaxID=1162670 RepID=A0ABP9DMF7_9BACT
MRVFFHPEVQPDHTTCTLPAEDSKHAVKVLRMQTGDVLQLRDGKGGVYDCQIKEANPKKCVLAIDRYEYFDRTSEGRIHIAMAPTKNMDRTEFFVEKAVEIGVDAISFMLTHHSERKVVKTDRVQRIAVSGMKQSRKLHLPNIGELTPFEEFVSNVEADEKFIAYVPENPDHHLFKVASPNKNYCVLIGPEGGFTEEEVAFAKQHGFKAVSLGKSRLRAETAALAACHTLNLLQIRD